MRYSALRRRFISWIATFAILMAALVPSFAQAITSLGVDGELRSVEVCTLTGIKHVPITGLGADPPGGDVPVVAADHCPYCSTHGASVALAPTASTSHLLSAASQSLPAAYLHAPRPLFAWLVPIPRAPPAHA